jgi:predicted kinase
VHLRSDVERKTLAGADQDERLPARAYTRSARHHVYEVLRDKARSVLAAQHSVVIDAVFAEEQERQKVEALAAEAGVEFRGLWLEAAPDILTRRVAARQTDASDATVSTLRAQLQSDPGRLSARWIRLKAGGSRTETTAAAEAVLGAATTRDGHGDQTGRRSGR